MQLFKMISNSGTITFISKMMLFIDDNRITQLKSLIGCRGRGWRRQHRRVFPLHRVEPERSPALCWASFVLGAESFLPDHVFWKKIRDTWSFQAHLSPLLARYRCYRRNKWGPAPAFGNCERYIQAATYFLIFIPATMAWLMSKMWTNYYAWKQ